MTRLALIIMVFIEFPGRVTLEESPPIRGWESMSSCQSVANEINNSWRKAKAKCVLR